MAKYFGMTLDMHAKLKWFENVKKTKSQTLKVILAS